MRAQGGRRNVPVSCPIGEALARGPGATVVGQSLHLPPATLPRVGAGAGSGRLKGLRTSLRAARDGTATCEPLPLPLPKVAPVPVPGEKPAGTAGRVIPHPPQTQVGAGPGVAKVQDSAKFEVEPRGPAIPLLRLHLRETKKTVHPKSVQERSEWQDSEEPKVGSTPRHLLEEKKCALSTC